MRSISLIFLRVTDGPDEMVVTGPDSAHSGGVATLYCSAESAPPASVAWTFEGKAGGVDEALLVLGPVRQSDGDLQLHCCQRGSRPQPDRQPHLNCCRWGRRTRPHSSRHNYPGFSVHSAFPDVPDCNCSDIVAVAIITTATCFNCCNKSTRFILPGAAENYY